MYVLLAYINGEWGIAGLEPHEECAVNFISAIDEEYGDGTAYVCFVPDKGGPTTSQKHTELPDMLANIEQGSYDFDTALAELNRNNKHKE